MTQSFDRTELTSLLEPGDYDSYEALYLHVPFCVRKCSYCDFFSEPVARDDSRIDQVIDQLCRNLVLAQHAGALDAIRTVYIGGGTPSFIGIDRLKRLLATVDRSLKLSSVEEFTVEANPESLSPSLLKALLDAGVNRISIGVQSFDDAVLRVLDRAHNASQARQALRWAQEIFPNVSIDLMAVIPEQSFESLENTLEEAIGLKPDHISLYPLILEEATPLAEAIDSGTLTLWDEDSQADALELAYERLESAGYNRYEVASFAQTGKSSRHNQAYWKGISYLGLGPSAVSMRQNAAGRYRYRDGRLVESLSYRQRLAEDLMLGVRTIEGPNPDLIARSFKEFDSMDTVIDDVVSLGLASWDGHYLRPTPRGFLLGNELYGRFLSLAP